MTPFAFSVFLFLSLLCPLRVEASGPTLPKADYVTPQTVKEWLAEKKPVTLIDVREPKEYEAGHIEGAINLPYHLIELQFQTLPKERFLVFYCISSSWRAPYAANLLKDHGFNQTYILEGGIVAWKGGGQTLRSSRQNQIGEVAPYPSDLKIDLNHPKSSRHESNLLFTKDELKHFDGKEGRPAYVAVEGKIYDVTQSRLWRGGGHDPSHGRASAGYDLTGLITESPHGAKELEKFPVVGWLINEQ